MTVKKGNIIWGIIGCGDVAEVKSGPAFQKCNNSELLAVMRRDSSKAKDFAKRHQVPFWYDDVSKLLQNETINAVYVATPPSSHLEYAVRALKAGKNVYLEKPMVLNKKEAIVLEKAVDLSKNKLTVAHYRRYLPMYIKVKELIEANVIGKMKYVDLKYLNSHKINTNWRLNTSVSGGGFFHDLAPHQIDLMYHFFGAYDSAKGYAFNQEKKHEESDIVNGIISFKNGIQFRGIWSFDIPDYLKEDRCTIYGSRGTISFPFYGNKLTLNMDNKASTYSFENPKHIQQPFIHETINYFLEKRTNPCSVQEGTIVTAIMDSFTNNINT